MKIGTRNAAVTGMWALLGVALTSILVGGGCTEPTEPDSVAAIAQDADRPSSSPAANPPSDSTASESAEIRFKDHVESNVEVPVGLDGLVFIDTKGQRVALDSYLGVKNVALVFTEGFSGMLCPFCKTHTSRLVANYERFQELDTEVLVVYPGTRDHLDEFIEAAKTSGKAQVQAVPFPIVLDEEFNATDFFNIRSQLAHPSTFIIDKHGNLLLAYVGADMTADRPSVDAILALLREANG